MCWSRNKSSFIRLNVGFGSIRTTLIENMVFWILESGILPLQGSKGPLYLLNRVVLRNVLGLEVTLLWHHQSKNLFSYSNVLILFQTIEYCVNFVHSNGTFLLLVMCVNHLLSGSLESMTPL